MHRGYTNYNEFESYNDGLQNASYAMTGYRDHVGRPVVVDAEGRKNPIIRYTPANKSEGYVMKAERVVEHVIRAPVVGNVMADYKYGSPEKEDVFKGYGVEKRYPQLGSVYDRPEKVENFLTKIQTEVSQANKPCGPLMNSNWRDRPISTDQDGNGLTKYGDEKGFIKGTNQKKVYSVPIGDKQNEGYTHISQGTNPAITNNKHNFYERPNEGTMMPSRPLSRPTTDINESMEFLTEGIKTIQPEVKRPTKPGNFAGTRWRNGYNFSAQGPKLDSADDDLEMLKEQKMYPRDNLEKYYQPERANPINNSKDYGKTEKLFEQGTSFPDISQKPRFTVPPAQPKEGNSYGETIDSSEAKRRYSKLKPQPVSEGVYPGAINSDDLIKKYNGAKVPW